MFCPPIQTACTAAFKVVEMVFSLIKQNIAVTLYFYKILITCGCATLKQQYNRREEQIKVKYIQPKVREEKT